MFKHSGGPGKPPSVIIVDVEKTAAQNIADHTDATAECTGCEEGMTGFSKVKMGPLTGEPTMFCKNEAYPIDKGLTSVPRAVYAELMK